MSTLTTLDGIEDGTDIAVINPHGVSKWVLDGGMMTRPDGARLDRWFFSGALREGKVMLGDFSPPVVGDWFTRDEIRMHLVVQVDPDQTTAHCARFIEDRFQQFTTLPDVVDTHRRTEPPAWVTPQLVTMTAMAHALHLENVTNKAQVSQLQSIKNNISYAHSYLDRAMEMIP